MFHPQEWSAIISSSVVPVVVISACGLLCLAFYNRLAGLISRLRTFQRERLEEQEEYARTRAAGQPDEFAIARHQRLLDMLEQQTRGLMRRANLVRRTILCLLGTIACLTLCSLATGLSVRYAFARVVAACLFFSGMTLLFGGVVLAIVEIRDSLHHVRLESEFVSELEDEFEESLRARPRRTA